MTSRLLGRLPVVIVGAFKSVVTPHVQIAARLRPGGATIRSFIRETKGAAHAPPVKERSRKKEWLVRARPLSGAGGEADVSLQGIGRVAACCFEAGKRNCRQGGDVGAGPDAELHREAGDILVAIGLDQGHEVVLAEDTVDAEIVDAGYIDSVLGLKKVIGGP